MFVHIRVQTKQSTNNKTSTKESITYLFEYDMTQILNTTILLLLLLYQHNGHK